MTMSMLRICTILAFGLAASQAIVAAQETNRMDGVWNLNVTVTDCVTGAPIRVVRSLQMFSHDGSFTETANTAARGISVGAWSHEYDAQYNTSYWFFRFKPDGTFASIAKASNEITRGPGEDHFNAVGKVQDYDANGVLISTGCVKHSADRLTNP